MRFRHSALRALRLVAACCALCLATAAAGAQVSPVEVGAALFRSVTTDPALESAADLRNQWRALWTAAPWDAECEDANRDSGAPPGLIRHTLADGSWLIEVACALGAYQGSFWAAQLWATQAGRGAAAVLRWPIASERAAPAAQGFELSEQVIVWGELGIVAAAPGRPVEAEIVNRFRAIGGCGTRSRYALQHGAARLVALAAAFACPDTVPAAPAGPADWPELTLPDR